MKKLIFIIFMIGLLGIIKAQNMSPSEPHTIEVTGSAEMNVDPDEIKLVIEISEYWKEEFISPNNPRKFKTKIPIQNIEKDLIKNLNQFGIKNEQILVKNIGNFWRNVGQEFLITKEFEISIFDFSILDSLIGLLDKKGIQCLKIAELKNKNITELRKQVKVNALKAAKDKADYLLQSFGKSCGDFVTIIEIDDAQYSDITYSITKSLSNNYLDESCNIQPQNYKKIYLRYRMKVIFEIN